MRAALLALLALLLSASPAYAHASLVRSTPAVGETLAEAPGEIVMEFAEELDPGFTRVQLFNGSNQLVNAGPGTIDPADPKVLRLALGELPDDAYTALWRARSAVDGHVIEGSLPFGVGVAAPASGLIPQPGAPDPATLLPPPLDAAARWLTQIAAALALGGVSFGLLVWRPALRRAAAHSSRGGRHGPPSHSATGQWSAADERTTRLIRRLTLAGCALLLAATALLLVAQAAGAAGVSPAEALGAPLAQLLASRTGWLALARIALLAALAAVAWRLPAAGRGPAWPWLLALAVGAAIIATFSLNSHGAAIGDPVAAALDWAHRAAMVVWLGGLVPLLAVARAARRAEDASADSAPLGALVGQFSRVAVDAIIILAITGAYAAYVHIGRLDLVTATTYGRALGLKVILFGLLLLLGAVNFFILAPRLGSSQPAQALRRAGEALRRTVGAELVLGGAVLLLAGVMTSVAPGKVAWAEHERQGLARTASVGDVDLTLRVAPAWIGDNEFAVDVADRRAGAQEAPSVVLLRFTMQNMDMGVLEAEATPLNETRYGTRGSFVSMGGRWDVEVILRRAGFDDVRHTFTLDVVRPAVPYGAGQ